MRHAVLSHALSKQIGLSQCRQCSNTTTSIRDMVRTKFEIIAAWASYIATLRSLAMFRDHVATCHALQRTLKMEYTQRVSIANAIYSYSSQSSGSFSVVSLPRPYSCSQPICPCKRGACGRFSLPSCVLSHRLPQTSISVLRADYRWWGRRSNALLCYKLHGSE